MKTLLLIFVFVLSSNAFAYKGPFAGADSLTQAQLTVYLQTQGYIGFGELPEIALDEEDIETMEVFYKGKTYTYIQVYSGDTEHGPLLQPGSLEVVGANGDGDFYLFKNQYIEVDSPKLP